MEFNKTTVIGAFSDLSDAKQATDELRSLGITTVRLVENEREATFTGTAEPVHTRQTGISGFFARLFGFDDERPLWSLDSDSEAYFQQAYDKKHHLVVIENCSDIIRSKEIIARFGGTVEAQGNEHYERELYRGRDTAAGLNSERVMELREEQLDVSKQRVQTGEFQVRKEIITETQTVEVPLTREEIVVERRPLTGAARDGSLDISALGETEEIRIPVSEEHVHIEKKVVPREEVRVSKEFITENEVVSEDVRHEEARVESEGRIVMKDRGRSSTSTSTTQPGV